jgi:hypothetical protein
MEGKPRAALVSPNTALYCTVLFHVL